MTHGESAAQVSQLTTRMLFLVALLSRAWLLWSGIYKPLLLGLGALSCLLTCYVARRMGYFDSEFFMLHFSVRLLVYLAWLAKEVVRSSLEVSRIVLDPRLPISPTIVDIDATALHPIDRAILGNSITLTPGTLALDVHRGVIKVHSLTLEGADALMSSGMERRVAALRKT